MKHIRKVAYELDFPNELAPVLCLKSVLGTPSIIPLEELRLYESLSYEEVLIEILDRQVKRLRNKKITFVKILWRNHLVQGATWEAEADMKSWYPHLFPSAPSQAWGNSARISFFYESCVKYVFSMVSLNEMFLMKFMFNEKMGFHDLCFSCCCEFVWVAYLTSWDV